VCAQKKLRGKDEIRLAMEGICHAEKGGASLNQVGKHDVAGLGRGDRGLGRTEIGTLKALPAGDSSAMGEILQGSLCFFRGGGQDDRKREEKPIIRRSKSH